MIKYFDRVTRKRSTFRKAPSKLETIINPQVGLVALFALCLGMLNTLLQVWQMAEKAKPQFLQPDQVLLVPYTYQSGNVFLRLAARLSYFSAGPPVKTSIITREAVDYEIGGRTRRYKQEWQSFEEFEGEGCIVEPKESKDVSPIILPGGSAASHVTYFAPRSKKDGDRYVNFQLWSDFVDLIRKTNRFTLIFRANVLNGDEMTQRCRLELTPEEVAHLSKGCAVTVTCER